MNKNDVLNKYDKELNKFGFGNYMIDFSDVSDKNMIKLCEFIKSTLEEENGK